MTSEIFGQIEKEINSGSILTVKELCSLAGVSRQGYYRWINAEETRKEREKQDLSDFQKILDVYNYRGYDKGVRGIYMRLFRLGKPMNKKKIRRLMRKYNLYCPVRKANPYRRLAKALKTDVVAANVLHREFFSHGPRKFFLTDITYIRFQDSFFYLSVIIDPFTMQVLSYVLSKSLEVDFVLETVKKMLSDHKITLDTTVYIHSDQGCHYTSTSFRDLLEEESISQSMSRRGNCWDNAPQESFFGHMKDEIKKYMKSRESFEEVKALIDDWIDYYNNDRYQTNLHMMSPNEYYKYYTTGILPDGVPEPKQKCRIIPKEIA